MKGWILILMVFILFVVLGYLNKQNYADCVSKQVEDCENEFGSNCLVRAKDFCNWVKKQLTWLKNYAIIYC